MSSHRTVLHLPVTFVLPPGTTPEAFAKFLADEAAMEIEKMSVADGDIEVAQTSHDTVTDAYPAPIATSNADAAGWVDPRCSACGHPITAKQVAAETDGGGLVHLFGCPDGATR
jgi:hypothetical protein